MEVTEGILNNKTILVTGGTGSFGKAFVRAVLDNYNPKAIRIYSRGELKQVEMEREFNSKKLRFLIGDIRDKNRLQRAMNGVDIVIHAAALKHVPVCEYNPIEAVRTNIDGTANVIDAAIDNNVEKVVALSTDKAVHPVNLYGATKLVAEKLITQANAYSGGKVKFSCVRYGNVMGSRGSVVPLFKKQASSGLFTITDNNMTRFWITLDNAVKMVLNALSFMSGGEIFVPKLPSAKIVDIADVISPDSEIKIIGIRPGEKLHETLITSEEAGHTKEFEDYFLIEPEFKFWDKTDHTKSGKSIEYSFVYSSDKNSWWLTKDEIKNLLVKEGWI